MLLRAVQFGASDVHLKVGQPPIIRRDGLLLALDGWPALDDERARRRSRDRDRVTTPPGGPPSRQTGELDLAYTPTGLPRFRVNGFRQRGSISFAFRVIPNGIPGFAELGLPDGVAALAEEHRGLVLVTGATGSGKSTTLAAIVGHINATRRQHIVTIEDPIEFLHEDRQCIVNQREVGLDTVLVRRGAPAGARARTRT